MSYLAAKTFNWKRIPEADKGAPNRFKNKIPSGRWEKPGHSLKAVRKTAGM